MILNAEDFYRALMMFSRQRQNTRYLVIKTFCNILIRSRISTNQEPSKIIYGNMK